ncbi:hypothetical protein [Nostoc sp.]|uniref:hypothetical protein n=1 Tax=Nostoc sp. TaxID=1180 RepID=UPI002FF62DFD
MSYLKVTCPVPDKSTRKIAIASFPEHWRSRQKSPSSLSPSTASCLSALGEAYLPD